MAYLTAQPTRNGGAVGIPTCAYCFDHFPTLTEAVEHESLYHGTREQDGPEYESDNSNPTEDDSEY